MTTSSDKGPEVDVTEAASDSPDEAVPGREDAVEGEPGWDTVPGGALPEEP